MDFIALQNLWAVNYMIFWHAMFRLRYFVVEYKWRFLFRWVLYYFIAIAEREKFLDIRYKFSAFWRRYIRTYVFLSIKDNKVAGLKII